MSRGGGGPLLACAAATLILPLAAVAAAEAGTLSCLDRAEQRALSWLLARSARDPQDLVDYLLVFDCASHVAGPQHRERLVAVTRARCDNVLAGLRGLDQVQDAHLPGLAVVGHVSSCVGRPHAAVLAALDRLMAGPQLRRPPWTAKQLPGPPDIDWIMSLFLLKTLGGDGIDLGATIQAARGRYGSVPAGGARSAATLYMTAHVVFASSGLLGPTLFPRRLLEPEVRALARASGDPAIQADNDLWPEIHLALSLIEGCPSRQLDGAFRSLMASQEPDGSWTPTRQGESAREHTTAMAYLALLARARCED